MRRLVLILVMFPSIAWGLTPTPEGFRLTLPDANTNPPNLSWAQNLVGRLRTYVFCAPGKCGGGGGGDSSTPTITPTPGPSPTPTVQHVILSDYITSFFGIPPEFLGSASYTDICGMLWTNLLSGNPNLVSSCPGPTPNVPIVKFVQFTDDPCLCQGSAFGTTQVNGAANASGPSCVAMGDNASCTSNGSVAIGKDSLAETQTCVAYGQGAHCNDVNGIAIGKDAFANGNSAATIGGTANEDAQSFGPNAQALGLNSIAFGNFAVVEDDAGGGIGIGPGSFVSEQKGVALGDDSTSFGGWCIGTGCYGDLGQFTFVGHLLGQSGEVSVGGSCGSGPVLEANSNDTAGAVTVGTGTITQCSVNFDTTWKIKPSCFANDDTSDVAIRVTTTTSAIQMQGVPNTTVLDGDTLRWGCVGYYGATPTATETATPTP